MIFVVIVESTETFSEPPLAFWHGGFPRGWRGLQPEGSAGGDEMTLKKWRELGGTLHGPGYVTYLPQTEAGCDGGGVRQLLFLPLPPPPSWVERC